ncbi:MAG: hypothetical protein ACYSWO_30935 [Planctomycetota bacterium]
MRVVCGNRCRRVRRCIQRAGRRPSGGWGDIVAREQLAIGIVDDEDTNTVAAKEGVHIVNARVAGPYGAHYNPVAGGICAANPCSKKDRPSIVPPLSIII